ncbi:MAG: DUF3307 domain-containing protein [Candidatus Gracilibacteria bacterium]|jgi:hypothetical protein
MIFLHLIIAHLLGDFVFQSNDLIHKKYKSWTGTLQHAGIIALCSTVALLPILQHRMTWIVIGIIFAVHFTQDCLKISFDRRYNKRKSTIPFFVDQIFHTALILFLSPLLSGLQPTTLPTMVMEIYSSQLAAVFVIGALLFSYVQDITVFQFARKASKKNLDYKANIPGMLKRLGLFTLFYGIFLILTGAL